MKTGLKRLLKGLDSLSLPILLSLAAGACTDASAQATPTASKPGTSISIGATYSNYQADYGKRDLGGYAIYADWDKTPRLGLEFEARVLRFNEEVGTHETTFLIGPKVTLRRPWFNPYAKLLVGEGKFHFPYNYAEGSYLVLASGAGIDVPLGQSRYTIRAIDFEYQSWPNFTYGGLNPYGISGGLSIHIF
jgi:hypothetical protein